MLFRRLRRFRFAALCFCASFSVWAQPFSSFILSPSVASTNKTNVAINVSAPVGRTFAIDATTNFTSWANVVTDMVASIGTSYVDTNAARFKFRDFRGRFMWSVFVSTANYQYWETATDAHGRSMTYPMGWVTGKGNDGRMIAYPSGWTTNQGRDGHLIAYPSGMITAQGTDGRLIAYFSTLSTAQGRDGRMIAFPSSGWATNQGLDGRLTAAPNTSFSTGTGLDGRTVSFPSTWTIALGPDARIVSLITSDYTTAEGRDGRMIALPYTVWATRQGGDGRIASYPANLLGQIELDFQDQSLFAVLGTARHSLTGTTFADYAIYLYLGSGDEQFPD